MSCGLRVLDQVVECALAAAKWLVLPVVTLLFLQWPLRTMLGLTSVNYVAGRGPLAVVDAELG